MRCEQWKEQAFLHVEGTLEGDAERRFTEHLEVCAECRAEVAASRKLVRELATLPEPALAGEEAALFDARVMARLREAGTVAEPAAAAAAGAQRRRAARTVSIAARRRLDRPRFEPLFAPIPSLIALLLVSVAGFIGVAVLFGDTLSRGLGGSLNLAAQSIWLRTNWLAQEVIGRLVDLVTVANVTRGMFSHARPWLDAMNLLLTTHGQEILIGTGIATALVTAAVWRLRRQRRGERAVLNSSQ
jgi:hypothetical protein